MMSLYVPKSNLIFILIGVSALALTMTDGTPRVPASPHSGVCSMDLFAGSQPDDETTINDLAVGMGVNPLRLLGVAMAYGIRVNFVDDKISGDQAGTLRGLWAICGGELPAEDPKDSLPGFRVDQIEPEYDPVVAAFEDLFEIPSYKRHDRRKPPRKMKPQKLPPLTGTAAAAERQWPGISRDEATSIATRWTAGCGFTDTQAAAWWRHGLRPDEAQLARVLADLGGRPEHLGARFRTETLLDKLRDGLAPEHAIGLLRRTNLLGDAG